MTNQPTTQATTQPTNQPRRSSWRADPAAKFVRWEPRVVQRFFDAVQEDDRGCWLWQGSFAPKGYGRFYVRAGFRTVAHRFAFELLRGEVPVELQLDHLCRVRSCVNPWHLDVVDNRENQRRGEHPLAGVAYRTNVCPRGHSLDDAYVITTHTTGRVQRQCRTCTRHRAARSGGAE